MSAAPRGHLPTIVTATVGQRGNSTSANAASQSGTREMPADDAVALARGRFESLSVPDLDPSLAARDQPPRAGPTVATSTSGPFSISLVMENTPPFGK
jgi:hypothetical protein